MKRVGITLLIAIAAAGAGLLLVVTGTAVALSVTSWGRMVSGHANSSGDFLRILKTGIYSLITCVFLPAVFTVGFAVGRWAKAFPLLAAGVAVFPICVLASGFQPEFLWATATLLFA